MANKGLGKATLIIGGALSLIIGLILLPVMAGFIRSAKLGGPGNATGVINSTPVANISGLTAIIDLIAYGFCFGLVGVGIGMIYVGFKKK